ncbi:uncharacterized protein PADG_07527 [Paracoccidioides brasiliensis Pb18]|uniref:Uncharacterized protein n=1 Tax=Paracoccidioides brasiliensis (strain Pb18) TaxID=502780 RepID=C1GJU1_PARBD|nr:uncharacterized protein PADG_07527 [Paracoccidioides brasiliensis Pb18]EEH42707.2 hypothetical protein PADG_07527 [Paracoccidioides brasiliensis Pb18]
MGLVPAPNPAYFPIRPGTWNGDNANIIPRAFLLLGWMKYFPNQIGTVLEHPFSTCNSSVPRDKLTLTSPSQKIQSNQLGLDWRGLIGGASSNSPSPPNHCRRHFPELNSSIVQTCIPFAFHCFRAEQRELRSNTTTTMRMSLSGICQTILETDDGLVGPTAPTDRCVIGPIAVKLAGLTLLGLTSPC